MGCHFLLQGIFPTQGSNLGLLHCRQRLLPSEPLGKSGLHARSEGIKKQFPPGSMGCDVGCSPAGLGREVVRPLGASVEKAVPCVPSLLQPGVGGGGGEGASPLSTTRAC